MSEIDGAGNLRFPDDIPAPVGQICGDCKEPIQPGDFGMMVPHMADDGDLIRPIHGECLIRNIMGGIEHLTAGPHVAGTCYEGSTLTRRESAVAAYHWLREHP